MSALGMPPGKHGLGAGQEVFVGRLEPGYRADLVLLSPDLPVLRTFVDGQEVYHNEA